MKVRLLSVSRRLPHQQKGVVLIVALVALVAMALAGIAMVRSMGTGLGVAGNLAFRQNATSAGDQAVAAAVNEVAALTPEQLKNTGVVTGHYATWDPNFDPMTFDWDQAKLVTMDDGTGNTIRYVTHRLCEIEGQDVMSPTQKCVVRLQGDRSEHSTLAQGDFNADDLSQAVLRVTARIDGPRNTRSYVQVMLY